MALRRGQCSVWYCVVDHTIPLIAVFISYGFLSTLVKHYTGTLYTLLWTLYILIPLIMACRLLLTITKKLTVTNP